MKFKVLGLVLVFTLVLVGWFPSPAWAMDAALERDILEVIAQHPDAIAHALESYQQRQATLQQQTQNQVLEQVKQDIPGFIGRSPIRGDKTAKVMLVEFADFQCPYCAKAHAPIQALLDRHPEVAFVFKHLPLTEIHANAMSSAQAAWAAGQQGKFWQYYDRLFEQADVLGESLYKVIAQELHLNPAKFNQDRHSAAASQAIAADLSLATRLGISATPVFLVVSEAGTQLVSGADVRAIESHITPLTPSSLSGAI